MASTYGDDANIDGTVTVNESGADKDVRIEGDSDENLLFVNAGTNKVGIGTATPGYKLDVNGDVRVRGNDIRDNSGNPAISFDGSANTEIKGTLTAAQKYIYGYEEVTAGTSQTIALDKPITFVNNMSGDLTGSVADGSTVGETKWIIVNGYNNSNDLKITFGKASWGMGGAGYVTLQGGILQVVWGSVGGNGMWYPMTFASGSMIAGT